MRSFRLFKFLLFSMTVILNASIVHGVEPTWNIDLGTVFDNREGNSEFNEAKTYFLVTLAPEIGLKLSGEDRIAGGLIWNQPVENGFKKSQLYPTIYFRHSGERLKFSLGLFPRTELKEPLPVFLWCDSLTYFQRNIRGGLLQYEGEKGFADIYIDWRGIQSKETREAFNIMAHGEWKGWKQKYGIGAHLLMNHFAKTLIPNEGQYVVDNFLVNPYLVMDFSENSIFNILRFRVGGLITIERDRGKKEGWHFPGGFWSDQNLEWKFLGFRNSLYAGGRLFPLYSEYGNLLYQGESYYSSKFYDRVDLYAHLYRRKYIDLEAQLNFNFAKGEFMFYQRLILNVNIGNL